jgi:hypothetical protein
VAATNTGLSATKKRSWAPEAATAVKLLPAEMSTRVDISAACAWRQMFGRSIGDVHPDHTKIAGVQFENVGARRIL